MRITGYLMSLIALLTGVVGALLRRQEVASIFDPHSGLAERGAGISIALMAFSFAVVLLLFGLSLLVSRQPSPASVVTFDGGLFGTLLLSALGLIVFIFAALEAMSLLESGELFAQNGAFLAQNNAPIPLSAVRLGAAGLSGLALILMAILGPRGINVAIPSTVPVFWICIWLIVSHIDRASNPVLLSYVYNLFALAALLLALYYIAGYAFRQNRPGRLVFTCSAAVYFTGVTMGDDLTLYTRGTFLALAATVLLYQLALSKELARPRWREIPYMERDVEHWYNEDSHE